MRTVVCALLVAVGGASALAQPVYQFQMRLIADGDAGAPYGPGQMYSIGIPGNVYYQTRIGFWLQARVLMTGGGENWGIVRASSPPGATSFISLQGAAGHASLSRGTTNSANTRFGRGSGYRNGGVETGNTDNTGGSEPFPGTGGNENGGLDNGGSGSLNRRIYGFDAFVGTQRVAANPDDPYQPWNVNGGFGGGGSPVPQGQFSPWASLYRVWVDIPTYNPVGYYTNITLTASALLNGSLQAVPTDPDMLNWDMQPGPGRVLSTSYTFRYGIDPAPSAACLAAIALAHAASRRR